MLELLIVLSVIAGGFVAALVPETVILLAGALTTAVGLTFSVGTGLTYHILLARALSTVNALGPRWWWRPVELHDRLDATGRRAVLPWFYAGAAGFVVTVAGLALLTLGVAVGFWRGQ